MVDHPVDGSRAANDVSARNRDSAAVEIRLRRRQEAPVQRPGGDGGTDGGRNVNEGMAVRTASLEQADAAARILRQAVRENAPRGAGTDYHVVE